MPGHVLRSVRITSVPLDARAIDARTAPARGPQVYRIGQAGGKPTPRRIGGPDGLGAGAGLNPVRSAMPCGVECSTMNALVYDVRPAGWVACRLLRPLWPGVVRTPLGGVSLREVPAPELPGDDWVRLRTRLGGICGTDVSLLAQKQPPDSILQAFGSMPMGLGHENVADVESVGSGVDAAWVGKRVCVEPTLCCEARGIDPPCGPCAAGQFGACENFGAAGAGRSALPAGTSIGYNARTGGSLGERFVAHRRGLVEVPDSMPDDQALLTDPAACSLHAVLRCDLAGARRVLVAGAGTLGLLAVGCLRAVGFDGQLDLLGRSDYLRPVATGLGADAYLQLPRDEAGAFARIAARTEAEVKTVRFGNRTLAGGYDVVFDCIGTGASFTRCAKWTAGRGQLALVATASRATVDLTCVWFRELTIHGIYGRSLETFAGERIDTYRLVHRLAGSGALDLSGLLTHTFPLERYRAALAAAMDKPAHRAIKVALDFRNEGSR